MNLPPLGVSLVLTIAVGLASSVHGQYNVYDLGPGTAYAVNSSRTVAGFSMVGGNQIAFKYSSGVMETLGTLPGGTFSLAYDINNLGMIAGSSGGGSLGALRGFRYSGASMSDIGTLYGTTYANAINDSGVIVGESVSGVPGYPSHAFAQSGGIMTDLGTLGGPNSVAAGINSSGVIVGWADVSSISTHAFMYSAGVMTDLGSLGGSSQAEDINDAGTVVGYASVGGYYHAFRYSGGTMSDLGTLGGGYSLANSVNSNGDIVGNADTASQATHAFLYHNGVMVDLYPYLATLGLTGFSEALDINDAGDIVGEGQDASGHQHAFLLAVVPEPSTTVLLAMGLTTFAARLRPKIFNLGGTHCLRH